MNSNACIGAVARAVVALSFITQVIGSAGAKERPAGTSRPDPGVVDCQRLLDAGTKEECEKQLAVRLRGEPNNLDVRKLHAEALYQLSRFHYAVDDLKVVLAAIPSYICKSIDGQGTSGHAPTSQSRGFL